MWSRTATFRLNFVTKSIAVASLFLLVHCLMAQQPPAGKKGFQWNWRKSEELTAKQTLAAAKGISPEEKAQILSALAVQFKDDLKPKEQAAHTRIKLVDLNGDGIPEVIAQPVNNDYCSPTGNCPFWVFQKTAGGYKQLLDKGSVQTFTIQTTQTNGFSDLVLGMHGSATQQELFVYRFREGRYRRSACYEANWSYLGKDDEYHDLKEPRITLCGK